MAEPFELLAQATSFTQLLLAIMGRLSTLEARCSDICQRVRWLQRDARHADEVGSRLALDVSKALTAVVADLSRGTGQFHDTSFLWVKQSLFERTRAVHEQLRLQEEISLTCDQDFPSTAQALEAVKTDLPRTEYVQGKATIERGSVAKHCGCSKPSATLKQLVQEKRFRRTYSRAARKDGTSPPPASTSFTSDTDAYVDKDVHNNPAIDSEPIRGTHHILFFDIADSQSGASTQMEVDDESLPITPTPVAINWDALLLAFCSLSEAVEAIPDGLAGVQAEASKFDEQLLEDCDNMQPQEEAHVLADAAHDRFRVFALIHRWDCEIYSTSEQYVNREMVIQRVVDWDEVDSIIFSNGVHQLPWRYCMRLYNGNDSDSISEEHLILDEPLIAPLRWYDGTLGDSRRAGDEYGLWHCPLELHHTLYRQMWDASDRRRFLEKHR